jgi:hypothetical protein
MKEEEKVERNHKNDRKGVKILERFSSMHLFARFFVSNLHIKVEKLNLSFTN